MKSTDLLDALARVTLRPLQGFPARSAAPFPTGGWRADRRHVRRYRGTLPLQPVRVVIRSNRRPTR